VSERLELPNSCHTVAFRFDFGERSQIFIYGAESYACQSGGGSDTGRVTHSPYRDLSAFQTLAI